MDTEGKSGVETMVDGEEQHGLKHCPKCHKEYPANYDFCPDDAMRLVLGTVGTITQTETQTETFIRPYSHLSSKMPLLGLAAGLIVLGGVAFAAMHRTPSGQKAQSQMNAALSSSAGAATSTPTTEIPTSDRGTGNRSPGIGSQAAIGSTVTGTTGPWRRYENTKLGFSLDYPATWTADAPTNDGTSILVLFRSPDPHLVLLVDVDAPASGNAPLARWQGFDQRFARAYKDRYHLLSLGDAQLGGSPAAKWLFTVQKKGGPNLEKMDICATHQGKDFALLGGAPVSSYPQWQGTFEHTVQSFAWTN